MSPQRGRPPNLKLTALPCDDGCDRKQTKNINGEQNVHVCISLADIHMSRVDPCCSGRFNVEVRQQSVQEQMG